MAAARSRAPSFTPSPSVSPPVSSRPPPVPFAAHSCIISSPGNELRGYYLQPKEKRLGFKAFFQPSNYLRSTIAGALIMATSLGIGTYVTAPVRMAVAAIRAFILSKFLSAA